MTEPMTAGQKAVATKRARLAAGLPTLKSIRRTAPGPSDPALTAGQKAAATRRANRAAALGTTTPIPDAPSPTTAIEVSLSPEPPPAPADAPTVEPPADDQPAVVEPRTPNLWKPTEAGAAYAKKHPKGIPMSARTPARFKPTEPQPRIDKTIDAYVSRVSGRITADIEEKDTARIAGIVGAKCGQGWKIAATDGHRALVVKGKPAAGRGDWSKILGTVRPGVITLGPEFHLAVKQVRTCARPDYPHTIGLTLEPKGPDRDSARLVIWAVDGSADVAARAWVPVVGDLAPFEVELNAKYLDDVCGRWPLTLRVSDDKKEAPLLLFEVDRVRCLVMPLSGVSLRDTFERVYGEPPAAAIAAAQSEAA